MPCKRCGRHRSSSKNPSELSPNSPNNVMHPQPTRTDVFNTTHSSCTGLDPNFLKNPKHKGSVFNVGIARNYIGGNAGDVVALKWVRSHHDCETPDHVLVKKHIMFLAGKLVSMFISQALPHDWTILVNVPSEMACATLGEFSGRRVLVEPYVSGVRNISGEQRYKGRSFAPWFEALSHFSYMVHGAQFVMTGFQGGIDEENRVVILTDATVASAGGEGFGCSDTGGKGIRRFFRHHECSKYCGNWTTPKRNKLLFNLVDESEIEDDEENI